MLFDYYVIFQPVSENLCENFKNRSSKILKISSVLFFLIEHLIPYLYQVYR